MVIKGDNIRGSRVKGVHELSILLLRFLCKIKIIQKEKKNKEL